MPTPTSPAQERLLSVLRAARNRLEYLTQNDWLLIIDRAKRITFQKDEALIQQGMQAKNTVPGLCGQRWHNRFQNEDSADRAR